MKTDTPVCNFWEPSALVLRFQPMVRFLSSRKSARSEALKLCEKKGGHKEAFAYAQDYHDFAARYGAPGEARYWQQVLEALHAQNDSQKNN